MDLGLRGTIDAIFILRKLMQKPEERGINSHYHFVDFNSTFDTIWRNVLWKMMRSIGICNKIVNIIEKMHEKATCAVVVDGILTRWLSLSIGVRQGCFLYQLYSIFFLTLSWINWNAAETCLTWLWIEFWCNTCKWYCPNCCNLCNTAAGNRSTTRSLHL